jgi:glycosyltransferase involved in cell wall biosynthesis
MRHNAFAVDARPALLARFPFCAYQRFNTILDCVDAMPIPISAFIITKNEEVRLPATLAALRPWVDEILVVDSGSTDRTIEIARHFGARVLYRAWAGYGPQKRFAEGQCRNDWVLNVDADEVLTPELAEELRGLFSRGNGPAPGAYKARILTVYPGDQRPRPLANDYNVVRFYHRAVGSFRDHPVFDRVVLRDTVPQQLRATIFHHPYISFEHVIEKNNRFSSFRSVNSRKCPRAMLRFRLIYEFPLSFVKYYLFRLHFTGGWKGFYFALCHAFMRTSRIAKMLERSTSVGAVPNPAFVPRPAQYRKAS